MKKLILFFTILFCSQINFGQSSEETYHRYVGTKDGAHPLTTTGLQTAISDLDSGVVYIAYPGLWDTTGLGAIPSTIKLNGWLFGKFLIDGIIVASLGMEVVTHTITSDTILASTLMYGGKFYVTGVYTVTLPPISNGMSAVFKVIGSYVVSVDPDDADNLIIDGVTGSAGEKVTSGGTSGELMVIEFEPSGAWDVSSDGWINGG